MQPEPAAPEAVPSEVALPEAPADVELPATPEAVAATTEAPDASAAVATAADAAAKIGGDYAAILAVILAAIAVLGGKKAWDYYSERSQQRHALAVKELELKAQAQGLNGAQPPPCQAATLKLEAEITDLKGRLGAVEKKTTSMSPDFDAEDMERQLKRLQKTVKAMQEGTNG